MAEGIIARKGGVTPAPVGPLIIEYLVVAGGGGGGGGLSGAYNSGTGGAGGVLTNSLQFTPATSYDIVVGAGGAGGNTTAGVTGSNTTLSQLGITTYGGCGGG